MTEQEIREAGAQAVADFPPIPDEVIARIGAHLADLDKPDTTTRADAETRKRAA